MTDYFERDFRDLSNTEKDINKLLSERKAMGKGDHNSVMIEQKLNKEIETFGKNVNETYNGYQSKLKSATDPLAANTKLNKLNDLKKSYLKFKTEYEKMINKKYEYVRKN